jgi:hypothetical protein
MVLYQCLLSASAFYRCVVGGSAFYFFFLALRLLFSVLAILICGVKINTRGEHGVKEVRFASVRRIATKFYVELLSQVRQNTTHLQQLLEGRAGSHSGHGFAGLGLLTSSC